MCVGLRARAFPALSFTSLFYWVSTVFCAWCPVGNGPYVLPVNVRDPQHSVFKCRSVAINTINSKVLLICGPLGQEDMIQGHPRAYPGSIVEKLFHPITSAYLNANCLVIGQHCAREVPSSFGRLVLSFPRRLSLKMEFVGEGLLSFVGQILVEKFHDKMSDSAEEVTERAVGKLLAKECDEIKTKLEGLPRKDIFAGVEFLKQGILKLNQMLAKTLTLQERREPEGAVEGPGKSSASHGMEIVYKLEGFEVAALCESARYSFRDAIERFSAARMKATEAFSNDSLSIHDRIRAVSIQVRSQYTFTYYHDSNTANYQTRTRKSRKVLQILHGCKMVMVARELLRLPCSNGKIFLSFYVGFFHKNLYPKLTTVAWRGRKGEGWEVCVPFRGMRWKAVIGRLSNPRYIIFPETRSNCGIMWWLRTWRSFRTHPGLNYALMCTKTDRTYKYLTIIRFVNIHRWFTDTEANNCFSIEDTFIPIPKWLIIFSDKRNK